MVKLPLAISVAIQVLRRVAEVSGGVRSGVKVSWEVTGVRQDAWANGHRIPVEVDKAQKDQGHYLHPELFGHAGEPNMPEIHHPRRPATQQ